MEGVFIEPWGDAVDHAWVVDSSGTIIDPTFHERGVYFPVLEASKATLQSMPITPEQSRLFIISNKQGTSPVSREEYGDVYDKATGMSEAQLKKLAGSPKIDYLGSLDYRR